MPLWSQIALSIVTAFFGGGVGFGFGRLGRALDRRQDRRDSEAAKLPDFVFVRDAGGYRLVNTGGAAATNVTVDFGRFPRREVDGLPTEPFDIAAGRPFPSVQPGRSPIPCRLMRWFGVPSSSRETDTFSYSLDVR